MNLMACFTIAAVLVAPLSICRAATPEQVDDAIKKATEALWHLAEDNGGIWDSPTPPPPAKAGIATQWGGTTALCTYALLATGLDRDDPRFEKPIHFLERANITGIYALGLRANVWPYLSTKNVEVRKAVVQDTRLLSQGAHAAEDLPDVPAFYRYGVFSTDYDHSCSQYGVLGMWALTEVGGEVPMSYWRAVDLGWRKHQNDDGGWSYVGHGESTVNMTAAGVATLFITQQFMHDDRTGCPGNIVDSNIESGLGFLSTHFEDFSRETPSVYYGWYGVERIGVASGHKYFGATNWYERGADLLVSRQDASGVWGEAGTESYNTALALLFLLRGRAPVAINKLQYVIDPHGDKPKDANWDQRPRDAANIAGWIGKQIEQFLNWQIVNLDAPIEDLHDAPILYMAGNQNVVLRDSDYAKLKQYIEEGGLLVGNADCNDQNFVRFFQKLGTRLFGQYRWQELPADSPVFSEQFNRAHWPGKPSVQVLSNGARLLMVLLPYSGHSPDFAKHWQDMQIRGSEDSFELMDNLFLYAVDKGQEGGLSSKGRTYIVRPSTQPAAATIKVARLQYAGNWDPEPAGWPRLAAILHNNSRIKLDVDVQPVELGHGKLTSDFALAHLTGTGKVSLNDVQLAELKQYVQKGGTLVVDACGGDKAFGNPIRNQIDDLLASNPLHRLPMTDPAYTSAFPITTVAYRHFARSRIPDLDELTLEGIRLKDRTAVYFSGEDLSAGLVGQQVDGIIGYTPKTATTIMSNIVMSVAPAPIRMAATRPLASTTSRPSTHPIPP